jgi:hypothetical protein
LSCSMAFCASCTVAISTNPMAFDMHVVPSVTTSQLTTWPTPSNSLCNSESVVPGGLNASVWLGVLCPLAFFAVIVVQNRPNKTNTSRITATSPSPLLG